MNYSCAFYLSCLHVSSCIKTNYFGRNFYTHLFLLNYNQNTLVGLCFTWLLHACHFFRTRKAIFCTLNNCVSVSEIWNQVFFCSDYIQKILESYKLEKLG